MLDPGGQPDPGVGTFSPFRYPVFRAIWIANLFSNIGGTIQSVAAAWMMTELTTSHQLVALVQSSATLPIMLFGIFAGAIADNYDRRQVMLAAQAGMLLVSGVLAAMTYAGLMSPILLLAFTLSVGTGTALNSPAWQASVRQQVDRAQLPQAIALNSISFNIARSIGPALGGVLLSVWGASFAFLINALSYIGLIGVLLWWRPEARAISPRPILPAVAAGLRYCASSTPLRSILLRGLCLGISLAAFQALLPTYVSDQLGGTEFQFGLMLGLFGIGSISAVTVVGRIRRKLQLEGTLALGSAMFVVVLLLLAQVHVVWFALPGAFIGGMAWVMILTSINTAVQLRAPDEIVGRCLSIYQAVTFGGMALGAWGWGAVADWRDLPTAMHAGAAFLIVSFAFLRFVAPLPRLGEGVVKG